MGARLLAGVVLLAAGCASTASGPSTPVSAPRPAGCHYAEPANLPDPACTPGVTDPRVTQADLASTVCQPGYTATVRPPASYTSALKRRQLAAYGLAGVSSGYEEDHRVPLEAGGNPTSPANLWPEPWSGQYGAHAKDRHRE